MHFKREIGRVYCNEQNFQFSGTVCEILVDLFRMKILRWLEHKTKYMNTKPFWICIRGRPTMVREMCGHGGLNFMVRSM